MQVQVLFEDNHLLIVNKPAGLPVQGDQTGDPHLLEWAERYIAEKAGKPGAAFVGLVHRLDRPVSGAVVLAKTSKALARMNEVFRNKQNQKVYRAITLYELPQEEGTLIHYVGKDSLTHKAIAYKSPKPGAKSAILHYKLLANYAGRFYYEIRLETGRFHQIRVQLSKAGCPIVGDLKYGAKEALPDRSIALHSYRLMSPHASKVAEPIDVTAPLPRAQWWELFSGYHKTAPKKR